MAHEFCMSGSLTEKEEECALDQLLQKIEAAPADWKFAPHAQYPLQWGVATNVKHGVEVFMHFDPNGKVFEFNLNDRVHSRGLNAITLYSGYPSCQAKAQRVIQLLHDARHEHHNAKVVDDIKQALDVDVTVAQEKSEATIDKLKAAMKHPAVTTAAIAMLMIATPVALASLLKLL